MRAPDTTSWNLIDKAAHGDGSSRDVFATRYGPVVRAYLAARWKNGPLRDSLADAVQEVFVECFREGGVLAKADPDRQGGFRALLFGVVRNVALRHEKRAAQGKGRRAAASFDLEAVEDEQDSPSRQFDRVWAQHVLGLAVDTLALESRTADEPAKQRVELLRLRFQESLPIREIARLWEQDPVALHRQFTRAKQEFRRALLRVLRDEWPERDGDPNAQLEELLDLLG